MPMTLKQAKRIASRVGARIAKLPEDDSVPGDSYQITIPGRSILDEGQMIRYANSPFQAAHVAVIETGKHAIRLAEHCRQVYVKENLLWSEDL